MNRGINLMKNKRRKIRFSIERRLYNKINTPPKRILESNIILRPVKNIKKINILNKRIAIIKSVKNLNNINKINTSKNTEIHPHLHRNLDHFSLILLKLLIHRLHLILKGGANSIKNKSREDIHSNRNKNKIIRKKK
jgi:hypothetical protein